MKRRATISRTYLLKKFYLDHWQWLWTTGLALLIAALTLLTRYMALISAHNG